MKIKFWGVRGSIPIPGPATVRYGGNTPCIEVTGAAGDCVILDAGTGIRALGADLLARGTLPHPIHLLLSHTHWDHLQGFPFFAPCYRPEAVITVKGPCHFQEGRSLRDVFDLQMQYEFFPVSNAQLAASISYETLHEASFAAGSLRVAAQFMNHSVQALGYRLSEPGAVVVYTGDHEPYYDVFSDGSRQRAADDDLLFGDAVRMVENATERFLAFLRNADLVIVDCQYTPDEYPSRKRTWGHSSWDFCLEWMQRAAVRRMVLTHHDPQRTDDALDAMRGEIRHAAAQRGLDPEAVCLAYEGLELQV